MIDVVVVFLAGSAPLSAEGLVMVSQVKRVAHGLTRPRRDLAVTSATVATRVTSPRTLV